MHIILAGYSSSSSSSSSTTTTTTIVSVNLKTKQIAYNQV